jgi:hypothetical protein
VILLPLIKPAILVARLSWTPSGSSDFQRLIVGGLTSGAVKGWE